MIPGFIASAVLSRLPGADTVKRVLRWAGIGLLVLATVLIAVRVAQGWHDRQVERVAKAAQAQGREEQRRVDAAAFRKAWEQAQRIQAALIAKTAKTSTAINERQTDALRKQNDDLSRRYDALRLRWKAAAGGGNSGGTGQDGAAAVPGDAGPDAFAAAKAAGWVDFETAATLAEAADRAVAADDAKLNWYRAQCAAWPGPKPPEGCD